QAFGIWRNWGALHKCRKLEVEFPGYFAFPSPTALEKRSAFSSFNSMDGLPATLDVLSVLKASQAISGEIVLDHLLEKLMQVVIENAGGSRGVLILNKNDNFYAEAEAIAGLDKKITILSSVPVQDFPLPGTVISL